MTVRMGVWMTDQFVHEKHQPAAVLPFAADGAWRTQDPMMLKFPFISGLPVRLVQIA
jgi:hypothetical protein